MKLSNLKHDSLTGAMEREYTQPTLHIYSSYLSFCWIIELRDNDRAIRHKVVDTYPEIQAAIDALVPQDREIPITYHHKPNDDGSIVVT